MKLQKLILFSLFSFVLAPPVFADWPCEFSDFGQRKLSSRLTDFCREVEPGNDEQIEIYWLNVTKEQFDSFLSIATANEDINLDGVEFSAYRKSGSMSIRTQNLESFLKLYCTGKYTAASYAGEESLEHRIFQNKLRLHVQH